MGILDYRPRGPFAKKTWQGKNEKINRESKPINFELFNKTKSGQGKIQVDHKRDNEDLEYPNDQAKNPMVNFEIKYTS